MSRDKIKIMYLVLEMDLGGLQRIVNLLIHRIDREKFDPCLCCLDRDGLFYEEISSDTIERCVLGRRPGPFDLRMFKQLIKILKEYKIDLIHSHNGCSLYAALAGRLSGVKGIIHTDHGRLVPDRHGAIWEDRIASLMMDRFVGVSNELTDYLVKVVKVSRKKLVTIINGVDSQKFTPLNDEEKKAGRMNFGLNKNARIMGTVCRLDPIKNLDLLIESVPVISKELQDLQAVIVGDGPEEKNLMEKAKRLNLNSKVIFLGRVADVDKVLPLFDLYVNTSLSEGTSMTILEAMSCGLPVVASAVGGNISLVDDSNGALFPSGRADFFQENIINILRSPVRLKEMGRKSRQKVEVQFRFDRVIEQYEELYLSLANKQ